MIINDYELTSELTNANSGFSKLGFAVKNGREYIYKRAYKPGVSHRRGGAVGKAD